MFEELIREMEECLATMERINGNVAKERRGYKDEEKTEYERCKARYSEIQEQLEERGFLEQQRDLRNALGGQNDDEGAGNEERSFDSIGDVASAAYSVASQRGFTHEKRDLLQSAGSSGGFLVPTQHIDPILTVKAEGAIVRPLAVVIPGDPAHPDQEIEMPALKTGALGEYGGWTFEGTAEGAKPSKNNDLVFEQIKLKPKEQKGLIKVSEKLMSNAPALDAFLRKTIGEAKSGIEDHMFLTGDGTKGAKGILNSDALLTLARKTTGAITFADVRNMLARQLDLNKAIWTIARSAMAQIVGLADDNGNSIFIAGDATKGISDRLLGYPIKWTTHTAALGNTGDILFTNFKYYLINDGTSFRIAVGYSGDDFDRGMVTMRALWDVDGKSWVNAPIQKMDGLTYTPFVGLKPGA